MQWGAPGEGAGTVGELRSGHGRGVLQPAQQAAAGHAKGAGQVVHLVLQLAEDLRVGVWG